MSSQATPMFSKSRSSFISGCHCIKIEDVYENKAIDYSYLLLFRDNLKKFLLTYSLSLTYISCLLFLLSKRIKVLVKEKTCYKNCNIPEHYK